MEKGEGAVADTGRRAVERMKKIIVIGMPSIPLYSGIMNAPESSWKNEVKYPGAFPVLYSSGELAKVDIGLLPPCIRAKL